MKKLLLLTLFFGVLMTSKSFAQAGDPPSVLQQMKDKVSPLMVEKTGLTAAQADRVIELNYETRMAAAALKDLPEAERVEKFKELKAAKEKKMSELLTADQIVAVKNFYEEMGKNAGKKP
ncbi:MAG: hypothetical protein EOO06_08215 [Chitinophagaceae bacterium]|nr:MAG: hypothetical protein EOO06_08215 [Chitinophagaceae bacterium]